MRFFFVFFGFLLFYAMPANAQKERSKEDLKVGRLLQKETPKLEKCYRSFVKTHPDSEGRIVVHFTISEDGRVKNVDIEEGSFASAKFSKCVTKAIANLRFFEHLKKELKQKRTFVFAKKQDSSIKKESLSTLISLEKTVDGAEISRRIKARTKEITQCYVTFLKRKPTVENGKVVISFTIGEKGEVKNSHPFGSTFSHPDIGVCVAKIIGNIAFSKPAGKQPLLMKKIFVFELVQSEVGKVKRLNHLKKWLRPHQSAVNQCILKNSKKPIPDEGKLVARLYLKDKKLRFIKKVWSTFEPTVDACIISEIKKWDGSLGLEGIGPMRLPFEFVE